MKTDNKGFSFVELLVVLAILAVGATSAVSAFSYFNSSNVKKAINSVKSEMTQMRTNATAYAGAWELRVCVKASEKGEAYVQVFKQSVDDTGALQFDASSEPVFDYSAPTAEIWLGSRVDSITYTVGAVQTTVSGSLGGVLRFSFKNSTGGIDKMSYGLSGSYIDALSTDNSFGTLTIKNESGKTASLKIFFVSGAVEIV